MLFDLPSLPIILDHELRLLTVTFYKCPVCSHKAICNLQQGSVSSN